MLNFLADLVNDPTTWPRAIVDIVFLFGVFGIFLVSCSSFRK